MRSILDKDGPLTNEAGYQGIWVPVSSWNSQENAKGLYDYYKVMFEDMYVPEPQLSTMITYFGDYININQNNGLDPKNLKAG